MAAILAAAATVDSADFRQAALMAIAVTFLVSAVVGGVASHGRHLSWIVFLAIGALTLLGM